MQNLYQLFYHSDSVSIMGRSETEEIKGSMLIGIVSDTHNQRENLAWAAECFRAQSILTVLHCGDVTHPEMLRALAGFEVYLAFGNGDNATGAMDALLKRLNPANQAADQLTFFIADKSFLMMHGDRRAGLSRAILSGEYDYVIHGHTHRFRDEMVGNSRVINPGALGGVAYEPRSAAILDVGLGVLSKISLDE